LVEVDSGGFMVEASKYGGGGREVVKRWHVI
jgi:hypothetical protein